MLSYQLAKPSRLTLYGVIADELARMSAKFLDREVCAMNPEWLISAVSSMVMLGWVKSSLVLSRVEKP